MSKVGLISLSPFSLKNEIDFKKLFLMFDKIYVLAPFAESIRASIAQNDITLNTFQKWLKKLEIGDHSKVEENWMNMSFLKTNKALDFLHSSTIFSPRILDRFPGSDSELIKKYLGEFSSLKGDYRVPFSTHPDIALRVIRIIKEIQGEELIPLVDNIYPTSGFGKKTEVLKFIISDIPRPNDDVPWEQLIEFKEDADTMRKYYALINWINNVARKDFSLNEIKEEYKYLHSEYANQYKVHKMKHRMNVIETIVTASIDCLSGQLGAGKISTSLFSIWKHNLNLLEAETKFTGREVAYIDKIHKNFKSV